MKKKTIVLIVLCLFICIPLTIVAQPLFHIIKVCIFPPTVVEIGDNMVDAKLFDINGKKKRLSDYSDKYLLLNFWSENCGISTSALPEMKEISENYCENLTAISINLDTKTT